MNEEPTWVKAILVGAVIAVFGLAAIVVFHLVEFIS
jgi:hypothetical protein